MTLLNSLYLVEISSFITYYYEACKKRKKEFSEELDKIEKFQNRENCLFENTKILIYNNGVELIFNELIPKHISKFLEEDFQNIRLQLEKTRELYKEK